MPILQGAAQRVDPGCLRASHCPGLLRGPDEVYHWPLLDQLFQLAEEAYEKKVEFAPLGAGIRGWQEAMQGDDRDVLTGDFLREIPGFVARSRTLQGAMMESVYFWIFVLPASRSDIETEFTTLRGRLRRAIAAGAR